MLRLFGSIQVSAAILLVAAAPSFSASVEGTRELSADQAVREALASNRDLQVAQLAIDIARGRLLQAGRLSNPEIELSTNGAMLAHGGCVYDVDQADVDVLIVVCDRSGGYVGSVNSAGRIVASRLRTETHGGCPAEVVAEIDVVASRNASASASYVARFDFAPDCVSANTGNSFRDCTVRGEAEWTPR